MVIVVEKLHDDAMMLVNASHQGDCKCAFANEKKTSRVTCQRAGFEALHKQQIMKKNSLSK